MNPKYKYSSHFPESLFPPSNAQKYAEICTKGYIQAEKSKVVMAGLMRDTPNFPHIQACIERIGELFQDYFVVIYENDSGDNTLELLQEWRKQSNKVKVISEKLGWNKNQPDHSLQRRKRMAYCRNKYLEVVQDIESDYTIVLDTDLCGISYEGIAHTIGLDLDAVGSNGLLYRKNQNDQVQRLYYDTWAFLDEKGQSEEEKNFLKFNRGEDPVEVYSCFGGLSIYKPKVLQDAKYEDWACDHVTLHKQIRDNGYKVWLNPSQIILYSEHYYNYEEKT